MRAEVEGATVQATSLASDNVNIDPAFLIRPISGHPKQVAHSRRSRPLAIRPRMTIKTRTGSGLTRNDRHVHLLKPQAKVNYTYLISAYDRGTGSHDELDIRDADYTRATSRPDGARNRSTQRVSILRLKDPVCRAVFTRSVECLMT